MRKPECQSVAIDIGSGSLIVKFTDGRIDYMPFDIPLADIVAKQIEHQIIKKQVFADVSGRARMALEYVNKHNTEI